MKISKKNCKKVKKFRNNHKKITKIDLFLEFSFRRNYSFLRTNYRRQFVARGSAKWGARFAFFLQNGSRRGGRPGLIRAEPLSPARQGII